MLSSVKMGAVFTNFRSGYYKYFGSFDMVFLQEHEIPLN